MSFSVGFEIKKKLVQIKPPTNFGRIDSDSNIHERNAKSNITVNIYIFTSYQRKSKKNYWLNLCKNEKKRIRSEKQI